MKDPTKEEMISYLEESIKGICSFEEAEFEIEEAIYWFAYNYHGGQWTNLYSILCTSPYCPSILASNVPEDNFLFDELVNEFTD